MGKNNQWGGGSCHLKDVNGSADANFLLRLNSTLKPFLIHSVYSTHQMICIPLRRCCSLDAGTKSCHATGLPNPRTQFLVIGRIVHFDFHPSSRQGNRGRVLGTLGGRRGQLHFPRGGDERLRTVLLANSFPSGLAGASIMAATYRLSRAEMFSMPIAESSPLGVLGAPLVATTFLRHHRTMPFAHSSLCDSVGAPLMAATSPRCAMPYTNSSFHDCILAPLVAAKTLRRTVPSTNSSFHGLILAPLVSAS